MYNVVAQRRGWVAEAPFSIESVSRTEVVASAAPSFVRQPDGGWLVLFPAPDGGVLSANDCVLDASPAELRVAFPGHEAVALLWPRGIGPAQREGLSARFSRKRRELAISIPGVQAESDSCAADGELLETGSALTDKPAPSLVDGRWDQMSDAGKLLEAELEQRVQDFRCKLGSPGASSENALMFDQETGQQQEVSMSDTAEALDMAGILMLHSATAIGDVAKVRKLVEARVNPNAQDELGASALEKACMAGRVDVAEALLTGGAVSKSLFGSPSSPLHRAVACGGLQGQQLVALLCAHRANPKAKDRSGRTPIDLARSIGMQLPPELR